MKKILSVLICLVMLLSVQTFAASLTSVEINQTIQDGEELYVFFHADDENDEQIRDLGEDAVRLELGGQHLTAEVQSAGYAGIGYVFALDVSSSLSAEQFAGVQTALKNWVGAMGAEDMAAIVTFGETVTVVTDFIDNENTLTAIINGLRATDAGTDLYSGMMKAVDIANRRSEDLPLQRAVVIISDGMNDGSYAASLPEVESNAMEAGISLYIAGVQGADNADALAELGSVARRSGGRIFTASKDALGDALNAMNSYIGGSFMAKAQLPAGLADGSEKGLVLSVMYDGITVDDSVDVRIRALEGVSGAATEEMPVAEVAAVGDSSAQSVPEVALAPVTAEPAEETVEEGTSEEMNGGNSQTIYFYIGGAVVLVGGLAAFLILMNRKRKNDRQKKKEELSKGYGGYGGYGGSGGTMPMDATAPISGTMRLDDFGGGQLVLTDVLQGRSYSAPMKSSVSIGRREGSNDIVIADGTVSGNHCVIVQESGRFYVRDAGSSHGTYVVSNGLRHQADSISGWEIHQGDEIDLGKTRLEVSSL